jgi:hypothetical protein
MAVDKVTVLGKQNKVYIKIHGRTPIVGDPDGDFLAVDGGGGTVDIKETEENTFVVHGLRSNFYVKADGTTFGSTVSDVVSNLNALFNVGTSLTAIDDVVEAVGLNRSSGQKMTIGFDNGKFQIQNVPGTNIEAVSVFSDSVTEGARITAQKTDSAGTVTNDRIIFEGGTNVTVSETAGTITFAATDTNTQLTTEQVQDIVGAMFTSNTETRISATYEDSDGTIDLVVDDMTADTNTNIGNTDMTLSGARAVNMNGNDLDFKDGSTSKLLYDDSEDEWVFNSPVVFKQPSAIGEIRLQENPIGGDAAVVLKGPNTNIASDVTFNLPSADGSNGDVLKTNGSGVLSFSSALDGSPTLQAASTADLNGEDFTINVNGGNFFVKEASSTRLQVDQTDVVIQGLTFPSSDGSAGQVLKTNGSGVLSFVDQTADTNTQLTTEQVQDIVGAMFTSNTETRISATYEDSDGTIDLVVDDMTGTELANDSSPQLGGDLDVNGNKITSASNGDVVIDPDGTGAIKFVADEIKMEGRLGTSVSAMKFYEFGVLEGNYIGLKAPFSVASDCEFVLPGADGSAGQVLKTDGSKNLSFTNALDGVNSELTGVTSVKDAGATRGTVSFYDDAGDNFTALRAADTLSADTVFHLPAADGSAGQFLKTDGSGNLSFGAATSTTLTQVYSQSFLDNIGTTKHYLPFKDINEQTTIYQEEAAMFMPFDGKVRSVSIRIPAITGTSGNMTIGVHTINTGNTGLFSSAQWTTEETETVAVATTDDHKSIHFVFDNAQHFEAGDLLSISIQCSTSLFGGSKYVYVSTILDYDTSNTMPASSQVLSSNP